MKVKHSIHFVVLVALFSSSTVSAKESPNVLLIVVDDMNDWVGCLGGHPNASTPHIDRLAKRGVLFTNAHCQAPICQPSRSSLLTGTYPWSNGVYDIEQNMRDAPLLKDAVGDRRMLSAELIHSQAVIVGRVDDRSPMRCPQRRAFR